jgi:hypothetical protein
MAIRPAAYLLAAFLAAGVGFGQQSLPGCEPRPEVRQVLKEKLNLTVRQSLKHADLVALQRKVLEDLIARYPRESEPYTRLIQFVRWDDPDQFPALQSRLRQQAAAHPEDPLALYVAGVALFETDTPESIRLLDAAKAKAPDFAWPNFELAQIYSAGQRADKKKAAEYVAAFFSDCPNSEDRVAHRLLAKFGDPALQARVGAALPRVSIRKPISIISGDTKFYGDSSSECTLLKNIRPCVSKSQRTSRDWKNWILNPTYCGWSLSGERTSRAERLKKRLQRLTTVS